MSLIPPNCYMIGIYKYGSVITYYWCHDKTMLSNSVCNSILEMRRVYEDNDCEQSVIKTRKLYGDDGIIVFPPNVPKKFYYDIISNEGDIISKRKKLLYEIEEHVYKKKQEEKRIARGRKNTKSARAV